MKRKDYIDLKGKTVADLTKMVSVKRTDAIKKKMQILGGKEKNLKVYRNLRADIAKILTLIREKEILEKVQPKEEIKAK
ncbi:MAG: 50S ribosomal protein L29 [Candidatus Woesebacteria bacterium]|nr:50S ribosomal protein L29 [Candidatus Woesebacteria bacterium]